MATRLEEQKSSAQTLKASVKTQSVYIVGSSLYLVSLIYCCAATTNTINPQEYESIVAQLADERTG